MMVSGAMAANPGMGVKEAVAQQMSEAQELMLASVLGGVLGAAEREDEDEDEEEDEEEGSGKGKGKGDDAESPPCAQS